VSADPIGQDAGIHLYTYAENRPGYLTDPLGRNPIAVLLTPAGTAALTAFGKACLFLGSAGAAALGIDLGINMMSEAGAEDEGESKQFDEDQEAAVELAKEAADKGGLTEDEAEALVELGNDVGLPSHGPETHPGRPFGKNPHIHVGPVGHIPVK
jgi:hypothetical protein